MSKSVKNRFKSFGWRLGVVIAVTILNELSQELTTLGFSGQTVVLLSLVISEVTKYLNTKK